VTAAQSLKGWTYQQDRWLRVLYPNTPNLKIADVMGRSYTSIKNRATALGLSKCPEYIDAEKPGCFRKGHTTWNKGIPFESRGRSPVTQFKTGGVPPNTQPIGTEVVDSYGYRKRKVRDDKPGGKAYRNWRFVHVIVWEQHNGPLPKGQLVRFRDSDITNFAPGNLVALTRGENAVINRWMAMGELPEGGMDVLITLAKIKIAQRKRAEELLA
jgi:hypothetical protein